MPEPVCKVEVGIHIAPFWRDLNSDLVVCSWHHEFYLKKEDRFDNRNWQQIPVCIGCGTMESLEWWKCCPTHTSEQGPDIVCDACRFKLHPPKLMNDSVG